MAYISEPIFAGDFNDVLRLFHDEEQVRQYAFGAIVDSAEKGCLTCLSKYFSIRL